MKARMLITPSATAILTFPYHADLVEGLKQEIPASYRSYDPDTKAWTVENPYIQTARNLITFAYPAAEIIDESLRFERPRHASGPRDAYIVLHLQPTAPPELVAAAYKTLSRLHHPDAGGATATMQAINEAVAILRKGT